MNRLPLRAFLGAQKWRNRRERDLDCMEGDREDRSIFLVAFSHVTCTCDPLAAGSELPRSCRNHSLLHMQRYCHRFAYSRLRLVSFLTSPAGFFLNASYRIEKLLADDYHITLYSTIWWWSNKKTETYCIMKLLRHPSYLVLWYEIILNFNTSGMSRFYLILKINMLSTRK